jgi:hypothetical protein
VGEGESPWLEYWDESADARYWYNQITHEASWTKPPDDDLQAIADAIVPPGPDWTAAIDTNSGRETWINDATGEILKTADSDALEASRTPAERRAMRRKARGKG